MCSQPARQPVRQTLSHPLPFSAAFQMAAGSHQSNQRLSRSMLTAARSFIDMDHGLNDLWDVSSVEPGRRVRFSGTGQKTGGLGAWTRAGGKRENVGGSANTFHKLS